ncbi:MAG: YcxB family protein [Mucilaginibacter sp.]
MSWKSPEKRWHRILATAMPMLVLLALMLFDVWDENLINDKKQILWLGITFGFIFVASIVLTPFYLKSVTDNKINKFLKKDNNATLLDPKELDINENGLTEISNDDEKHYPWQSIIKMREINQYLYLYLNPITVIVLRKDMFDSEQDFQSAIVLIKANITL